MLCVLSLNISLAMLPARATVYGKITYPYLPGSMRCQFFEKVKHDPYFPSAYPQEWKCSRFGEIVWEIKNDLLPSVSCIEIGVLCRAVLVYRALLQPEFEIL